VIFYSFGENLWRNGRSAFNPVIAFVARMVDKLGKPEFSAHWETKNQLAPFWHGHQFAISGALALCAVWAVQLALSCKACALGIDRMRLGTEQHKLCVRCVLQIMAYLITAITSAMIENAAIECASLQVLASLSADVTRCSSF